MRFFSFLLLAFALLQIQKIQASSAKCSQCNPSRYVNRQIWEKVQDYLMPEDHPIKEKLDQIFLHSRALADQKSMLAAGFESAQPQKVTQIIVTRHPHLPGYVIKAYLDATPYGPKGKPDYQFLIKRIIGSRLVQKSIQAHHYEHLLKVPEKWLYLLPDDPSPPSGYLRRLFILVEDDMDILSNKKNLKHWKSPWVTEELLNALYLVIKEVGLADSAKPKNCPFSKDGKVALIDTQMFHMKKVKYQTLTPYLLPALQSYWKELINNKDSVIFSD